MTSGPLTARRHGVDDHQPGNELLADALAGLVGTPKRLPSKYFYDARGRVAEGIERVEGALADLEKRFPW